MRRGGLGILGPPRSDAADPTQATKGGILRWPYGMTSSQAANLGCLLPISVVQYSLNRLAIFACKANRHTGSELRDRRQTTAQFTLSSIQPSVLHPFHSQTVNHSRKHQQRALRTFFCLQEELGAIDGL